MIKTIIASTAAITSLVTPAAIAGAYVNVEANSGFIGTTYTGTNTDFHVGYEGGNDVYGFYVQGGPSIIAPEGIDSETRLSGKIGGTVAATEKLGIYGEFSLIKDDEENLYGTKIGAKFSF